jgi:hypothetical protein
MSRVRDNERYLAFSPAVSQAFLVHFGEVRHKIVGHKKVTLENKMFNMDGSDKFRIFVRLAGTV